MRQQTRLTGIKAKFQSRRNARNFTVTEYCVPEWALNILFDDTSNLEEDEDEDKDEAAVAAFLRSENLWNGHWSNGHWSYDSENEAYFSWRNDITNIGGNCVDIKWIQWIE